MTLPNNAAEICPAHGTPYISPGICPFCDEPARESLPPKWKPKLSKAERAHIDRLRAEIEPRIIAAKAARDSDTRE